MKIVVIGASGQLGSALMEASTAHSTVGVDHQDFDIEIAASVAKLLQHHRPDLVINTAAFHNVERCETQPERAFAVNALAVDRLAMQCASAGAALAHISTDYVFDGTASTPYVETDRPNPLNAYGISKFAGELLIRRSDVRYFIFRTSGLYGLRGSRAKGHTFIERILMQADEGRRISVVTDVTCSPSYTRHVAEAILRVVQSDVFGIYHVANRGACTWHEFAVEILRQANLEAHVEPTTAHRYAALVRRPAFSPLATHALDALGVEPLPRWEDGVRAYLRERMAANPH